MPNPATVSLDEILSKRSFSVRRTATGAEALTKIYKAPPSWDEKARSARFIMTAEIVDRYGDVVVAKGGDLTAFNDNPVALWAHNSRGFPIGTWSNLKVINGATKRMEGDGVINPEGTTEESDDIAKLIAVGSVRACSIGFMPLSWESIKDKEDRTTGYRFKEWELLECAACSVPANPAAIVKAAGGDEGLALQAIELVLDEWAMTPDGLIVPRQKFIDAYQFVRNKDVSIHEVRAVEEPAEDGVELNPLDIEAAVSRGITAGIQKAIAGGGFVDTLKSLLGIAKDVPETVEEPAPAPEVTAAVEEDDGETEEQFQARIAAAKQAEDDLADEEAELALRSRAAELV